MSDLYQSLKLSVEELSLLYSSLGKNAEANKILKEAHQNFDELDLDALLSSAGHSLLARGYCSIDNRDQLIIKKEVKKVIEILVGQDQIFFINILSGANPLNITIFNHSTGMFCSVYNSENIVFTLEYGLSKNLAKYLNFLLADIVVVSEENILNAKCSGLPIRYSTLPKALEAGVPKKIYTSLIDLGWNPKDAKGLTEDIKAQVLRGTIVRFSGTKGSFSSLEDFEVASRASILLLRGLKRSWAFTFGDTKSDDEGDAQNVDGQSFEKILSEFVD
jgi:hypothetical protein